MKGRKGLSGALCNTKEDLQIYKRKKIVRTQVLSGKTDQVCT